MTGDELTGNEQTGDAVTGERASTTEQTTQRRFGFEAIGLGLGVVALLGVALLTLLSFGGGDDGAAGDAADSDPDQLAIGTADVPRPTYDASIRDTGDGRDIRITDEPIVIDADGNIVDLAGGNGDEPLPSEADGEPLELPDDVFTGASGSVAATTNEELGGDDGTNLLGGDDPEDKRMPDLICRGLQAAQDEIQDRGVFFSKSEDATGRGRRQLWDRNWIVVAQDPEPGEKIGEFDAVLYVVKKSDDENICD